MRLRRRILLALSVTGAASCLALIVTGITNGRFPIPGGDVAVFLAAGDALRTGGPVYHAPYATAFYYAPPLAVLSAVASLLPGWLLWAALVVLDVAGLRYLAGSWTRVGLAGFMPLTAFQLVSGNPNFAVLAAILAAHRHHAGPVAIAALAKLGPGLGVPRSRWQEATGVGVVAVAITVPWAGLWPEWVRFLLDAPKDPGWPILIPIVYRLPVILGLLLLRRPWAQMLAAALAIPGFYLVTAWATVLLAIRLTPKRSAVAAPSLRPNLSRHWA